MTNTETQPDLFGETAGDFFARMMEKHPDRRVLFQKASNFCRNYLRPRYARDGNTQLEPAMSIIEFAEWISIRPDHEYGLRKVLQTISKRERMRSSGIGPTTQAVIIDALREEGFLLRKSAVAE